MVAVWGIITEGWGYWGLAGSAWFAAISLLLWRMVFVSLTGGRRSSS